MAGDDGGARARWARAGWQPRRGRAGCTALLVAALLGCGGPTSDPATGAAVEERPERVVLWDGGDLDGWAHAGPGEVVVVQTADGPVLETRGGLGLLWYDRRAFDDVEVRLQWRVVSPDDNSGVFLGFPDPGGDPWVAVEEGVEVQVYDGAGGDPQKTGSVYGVAPLDASAARPAGEWNDYRLRLVDGRLEVRLNGELVNSADVAVGGGHVGLQNHGPTDRVQFRSVVAVVPATR